MPSLTRHCCRSGRGPCPASPRCPHTCWHPGDQPRRAEQTQRALPYDNGDQHRALVALHLAPCRVADADVYQQIDIALRGIVTSGSGAIGAGCYYPR